MKQVPIKVPLIIFCLLFIGYTPSLVAQQVSPNVKIEKAKKQIKSTPVAQEKTINPNSQLTQAEYDSIISRREQLKKAKPVVEKKTILSKEDKLKAKLNQSKSFLKNVEKLDEETRSIDKYQQAIKFHQERIQSLNLQLADSK